MSGTSPFSRVDPVSGDCGAQFAYKSLSTALLNSRSSEGSSTDWSTFFSYVENKNRGLYTIATTKKGSTVVSNTVSCAVGRPGDHRSLRRTVGAGSNNYSEWTRSDPPPTKSSSARGTGQSLDPALRSAVFTTRPLLGEDVGVALPTLGFSVKTLVSPFRP